jgi:hypothetical protein
VLDTDQRAGTQDLTKPAGENQETARRTGGETENTRISEEKLLKQEQRTRDDTLDSPQHQRGNTTTHQRCKNWFFSLKSIRFKIITNPQILPS